MNAIGHFITITRHKLLVLNYCFRVGLYRQGLLHDLSKYSPTEFIRGSRYYQGNKSPNDAERQETGRSVAWMHHKGRNKHHYEYWTDYQLGTPKGTMGGTKMPLRYVVEMYCDRIAASQVYNGNGYNSQISLKYFLKGKDAMMIHPETSALLERLLRMTACYGEKRTMQYIRHVLLKQKDY